MKEFIPFSEGEDTPKDVLDVDENLQSGYRAQLSEKKAVDTLGGAEAYVDPRGEGTTIVLNRWAVQAHAFRGDLAAKIGVFRMLFGMSAQSTRAGIVHEAKIYGVKTSPEGRSIQIGVAVRLIAASQDFTAELDLTLPNLAADAQLTRSTARVQIDVLGYTGDLGHVLPTPKAFNVESLVEYALAFSEIQRLVLGEEGRPKHSPTVIAYSSEEGSLDSPAESGSVSAAEG